MSHETDLLERIYAEWDAVTKACSAARPRRGASTGMELEFQSANLWEIEDGQARRVRLHAHADDMVRELGLDAA
jgi:hypothetical protein